MEYYTCTNDHALARVLRRESQPTPPLCPICRRMMQLQPLTDFVKPKRETAQPAADAG